MTRFQVGGAVRPGAAYVTRPADHLLPAALLRGELCQVLAPRQMGKSSLRLRVSEQLAQEGYRTATVDLSGLGTAGVTPEAWFEGLCGELAAELDIPEPTLPPGAPLYGWTQFLGEVLAADPEPVVLFFDEIDILRRLPFGGADLLGGIRAVYERRAHDPHWARLMVCLVGAATPDALAAASGGAPFNVGTRIELRDFTRAEAATLAEGLPSPDLLEAVYAWTAGHPYMTLRLCEELAREGGDREPPAPRVARLVERLFLAGGPTGDVNLAAAGRELTHVDGLEMERISLYARVHRGPVPRAGVRLGLAEAVELSGMVAERDGRLEPRNRIFAEVFDHAWITQQMAGRPIFAALRAWRAAGERDGDLPRGPALDRLRAWAGGRDDLSADESAFLLRAAQEEMRRTAERAEQVRAEERRTAAERLAVVRGRLLVGIAVVTLLLVGAVVGLARALGEAEAAAARASAEAARATQLRLAAEATTLASAPRGAERALGLAVSAVGAGDPEAAPAAVLRALADGLSGASGWTLRGHDAPITGVACADEGATVLSRDRGGETRAWSAADGRPLRTWTGGDDGAPPVGPGLPARVAALQAQTGERGPLTRVPGPDGAVEWQPTRFVGALLGRDGAVRATLTGPLQPGITWGAFTPVGVLTLSTDDTLWRWSAGDGRPIGHFQLVGRGPTDVEVCPGAARVVVGAGDGTVALWKTLGGAARLALPVPDVYRVGWTEAGVWIGTYPRQGGPGDPGWYTLVAHDPQTGAPRPEAGPAPWLAWERRPQGDRIADATPSTLHTAEGARVRVLDGVLDRTPTCGRWSADGAWLAGGNQDGTVSLWDAEGRLVHLLGAPGPASNCPAFSPDGRRVVVGRRDATTVLYDVRSAATVRVLDEQVGTVRASTWSADGSRFATGSFDGSVGVWTADGAPVRFLRGHPTLVRAVAFSPDGRRLASAGDDAGVHVWDLESGELLAVLRGHTDVVRSLAFSPDGDEVVSSGDDGLVLIFPASPRALVAAARTGLGR